MSKTFKSWSRVDMQNPTNYASSLGRRRSFHGALQEKKAESLLMEKLCPQLDKLEKRERERGRERKRKQQLPRLQGPACEPSRHNMIFSNLLCANLDHVYRSSSFSRCMANSRVSKHHFPLYLLRRTKLCCTLTPSLWSRASAAQG